MPNKPSPKTKPTAPRPATGFSQAQVDAANKARDDSGSATTPRAVLDALMPIEPGGIQFQPLTMSVILALQRVNSGLLNSTADFGLQAVADALWIMTTPIDAVRAAIGSPDAAGDFPRMRAAVDAMCDKIGIDEMQTLGPLINSRLEAAFSTLIPHGVDKGTGAETDFPAART